MSDYVKDLRQVNEHLSDKALELLAKELDLSVPHFLARPGKRIRTPLSSPRRVTGSAGTSQPSLAPPSIVSHSSTIAASTESLVPFTSDNFPPLRASTTAASQEMLVAGMSDDPPPKRQRTLKEEIAAQSKGRALCQLAGVDHNKVFQLEHKWAKCKAPASHWKDFLAAVGC